MVYTMRSRRAIKGCLEVKAIHDTRIGSGNGGTTIVPKDSIGYVTAIEGLKGVGPTGYWTIYWVSLKLYGTHYKDDVKPTGKRG